MSLRAAVSLLGRFPGLAGVDLDVHRGELVALHGPNGAGKTTLLRLCAGLAPLSSGTATVVGFDLADGGRRARREVRRRVGLLGHGAGLYDDLGVDDNIAFWARAARVPDADAVVRARRGVGLPDRVAGVSVARLSAGQRRRTALACVLVRRPELWLLDEPHAGLDAEGRDLLDRLLHQAVDAGATVVVASHEHDRTSSLGARVVTLVGGAVVGEG
ncbi:MAG: heme ABC exporter ATP-binding protein CcmA [Acidimicrobiia bacterium]|nr:heme ABC exporter ATP-binding protein CcmA [Acidimicrobiia bacterium]